MPEEIEVKQPPTKATQKRTTAIGVGGIASISGLTVVVAYGFKVYANAHPGFETPAVAMGPEAGAVIYATIAGVITSAWQSAVSWMVRGTLITKGPDENEGA